MNIEIIGTQFVNKGAELMLLTILKQLKAAHSKNLHVCIKPDNVLAPTNMLLAYGLAKKFPHVKKGLNFRAIGKLIPKRIRDYCNIIIDQEIGVFLDASGFAYSDQWGKYSARNVAASVELWKRQGAKVIFLPQAFGPFTSSELIKDMQKIIKYADLIFARDEVSYKHLIDLNCNEYNNIKLAPDFTNLLSLDAKNDFDYKDAICITPNQRMLDKSSKGFEYLEVLSRIVNKLEAANQSYFFLIHEGVHDRNVINKLSLANKPNVYQTDDVVEIKKILGSVKGVVGSRFHGLVSALSQGTPSIAIGWSHKYLELCRDYDCLNCFIDLEAGTDIDGILGLFFDDQKYQEARKKLHERAKVLHVQSSKMWDDVNQMINR